MGFRGRERVSTYLGNWWGAAYTPTLFTFNTEALVIAGGGSGGGVQANYQMSGGGGAGGLRTATISTT